MLGSLLHFTQSETAVHEIAVPVSRMRLATTIKLIERILHRLAGRFISIVIQIPTYLTVKTNH